LEAVCNPNQGYNVDSFFVLEKSKNVNEALDERLKPVSPDTCLGAL
jgi:hypothetical protein